MKRYKTVDAFIAGAGPWKDELTVLRQILQETDLEECVKWGGPCYTAHGKNIVGMGGFKSYFGLWFYQGALLEDKKNVLINAQEGKTKALRQWRMTDASEIKPTILKRYVKEAIKLAEDGKEIKAAKPSKTVVVPPELKKALTANKAAGASFKKLTPGCQREYANHIAEAKREETKLRRIEKILPMIKAGGGLHDKYKNC